MKEKLKSLGSALLGLAIIAGILILIILALHGTAWVSEKLIPIFDIIISLSLLPIFLIILPLSFIKKCRGWCGMIFFYWSYLVGLYLWMCALITTLMFWGWFAVILGLFIAGVGVVPIAILASAIHGEWFLFGQLIFYLAMVIAARIYGFYLAGKAEDEVIDV